MPLGLSGKRLDQALAELFPDYSRSRLSAMIKDGAILVDGSVLQPKTKLLGGETIVATLTPREEELAFKAEDDAVRYAFIHADTLTGRADRTPAHVKVFTCQTCYRRYSSATTWVIRAGALRVNPIPAKGGGATLLSLVLLE